MVHKSLINGEATDTLSFQDRGLQYGDGLFETIAVYQNKSLCLGEHLARLESGCERLNLPRPEQSILKNEIESLLDSIERGVIKIIITRGQGGRGYAIPDIIESTRIITLYPWPEYPAENTISGINTRLCQYRYNHNPVLAGIKHLNRLEQIMARSEWTTSTVAEGIVMDQESNIIEGTMSNLFYAKDNILFTPDLSACGVAGVIRQKIIAFASVLKIELNVQKVSLESLLTADEVFLCNSIIGLWPVKQIDNHTFLPGALSRQIKELLEQQHVISKSC